MTGNNNILVFKTNIQELQDIEKIKPVLFRHTIISWNVDRADVDCVLRVVTPVHTEKEIIEWVTGEGFMCEELP
jgi:hypothetical protein